jgi:hypothetical protein
MAPPDEEIERIMDQFFAKDCAEDEYEMAKRKLIEEYGQEEAERLELYSCASSTASASWECRDCIGTVKSFV